MADRLTMNKKEFAARAGISVRKLERMMKARQVTFVRLGRRIVFREKYFEELMERNEHRLREKYSRLISRHTARQEADASALEMRERYKQMSRAEHERKAAKIDQSTRCQSLNISGSRCARMESKDHFCVQHWEARYGHRFSGTSVDRRRVCADCGVQTAYGGISLARCLARQRESSLQDERSANERPSESQSAVED